MSALAINKLSEHQEEIISSAQDMQSLIEKSETGRNMLKASMAVGTTEQMKFLLELLSWQGVSEEERALLTQYMGEMTKRDPDRGLQAYARYLHDLAVRPEYADRHDYYKALGDTALDVDATTEYGDYVNFYYEFQEDPSPEAEAARQATTAMQERLRALTGQ